MADNLFRVFAQQENDENGPRTVQKLADSGTVDPNVDAAFAALSNAGEPAKQPPGMLAAMVPFLGQAQMLKYQKKTQQSLTQVQNAAGHLMDQLTANGMDAEGAQAVAFLQTSRRLTELGFAKQGMAMRREGLGLLKASRDTALAREKLNAEIDNTKANAAKTKAEIPYVGLTDFNKNLVQREELQSELDVGIADGTLPDWKQQSLKRQIGWLDAKMLKDTTLYGKTQWDAQTDKSLFRDQFKDVQELEVLIEQVNATEELLRMQKGGEQTWWARQKAGFYGFADKWFDREPSESEQAFMSRVMDPLRRQTMLSAYIRHALTGAQMSHFEIGYLDPFLPNPDDSKAVTLQKLRTIKEYFSLEHDLRYQMFMNSSTYDWFKGAQATSND